MLLTIESVETRQHFWSVVCQQVGSKLLQQEFITQVIFGNSVIVPIETTYGDWCFTILFRLKNFSILPMQVFINNPSLTIELLREPQCSKFELPLVCP